MLLEERERGRERGREGGREGGREERREKGRSGLELGNEGLKLTFVMKG